MKCWGIEVLAELQSGQSKEEPLIQSIAAKARSKRGALGEVEGIYVLILKQELSVWILGCRGLVGWGRRVEESPDSTAYCEIDSVFPTPCSSHDTSLLCCPLHHTAFLSSLP